MKSSYTLTVLAIAIASCAFHLCTAPFAAQTQEGVSFEKQILPILEAKCFSCHQREHEDAGKLKKPKSGLALDNAESIMKGGKSYPGENVVAGRPDASWLLKTLLLPEDDDMFMPPKGDKVTTEEAALLKKWIEEGAKFGVWKEKVK